MSRAWLKCWDCGKRFQHFKDILIHFMAPWEKLCEGCDAKYKEETDEC